MDSQDVLAGVLAALHTAAMDDASWPPAWALINKACATVGNSLIMAEGSGADVKVHFAQFFQHGQRRQDLEREYFEAYYPYDERISRLRRLPDGHVVRVRVLYSEQQLRSSLVYNEWVRRFGSQDGPNGTDGTRIVWCLGRRIAPGGWGSAEVDMIQRLLPHIRQFVWVRRALARANVLGASVVALLDHTGTGAILLDRCGRIVEANGPARSILRCRDGLFDRDGSLGAWVLADNAGLQRLLARSLRSISSQGAGRRRFHDGSASFRSTEAWLAHHSDRRPGAGLRPRAGCGFGSGNRSAKPAAARCRGRSGGTRSERAGEPGGGHACRGQDAA